MAFYVVSYDLHKDRDYSRIHRESWIYHLTGANRWHPYMF